MKRTVQMASDGTRRKTTPKKPRPPFKSRFEGHHMFMWKPGPVIVFKPSWFRKILQPRIRRTAARPFLKTIEGRWNQSRSKYIPHVGGGKWFELARKP